jgi:hypothetical protein
MIRSRFLATHPAARIAPTTSAATIELDTLVSVTLPVVSAASVEWSSPGASWARSAGAAAGTATAVARGRIGGVHRFARGLGSRERARSPWPAGRCVPCGRVVVALVAGRSASSCDSALRSAVGCEGGLIRMPELGVVTSVSIEIPLGPASGAASGGAAGVGSGRGSAPGSAGLADVVAPGSAAGGGAGGASGAGGGWGAPRGGRSESGSTYASPEPRRTPRWT